MVRPIVVTDDMRARGIPWHEILRAQREPHANVKAFGAKGDGEADDTFAFQAALDYTATGAGYGRVLVPPGTYMVSNLHLHAPTILEGLAMPLPILKMISGSTGNMLEDDRDDNAQKIIIKNLQINGNGCTANGIVLGYNGVQHGGGAHLDNLWIRNFAGDESANGIGLKVNGNACFYHRIDLSGGDNPTILHVEGTANQFSQILHTGHAAYGIKDLGLNNAWCGIHCEGDYSSAAILIDGDSNQMHAVNVTVAAADTLPAAIEIASGEFNATIYGLAVYAEAGGTITAAIVDNGYSTGRTILGHQGPTTNYRFVPYFRTGRDPYVDTHAALGPPTDGEWWKGDRVWQREAASGEPAGYVCLVQGSPGTWGPLPSVPGTTEKDSNYSIAAADLGIRFSNGGAAGTTTFSLPAGSAGQEYEFVRIASQTLRVDPDGTEVIRGGGAGKYLQLDADGDRVRLAWDATSGVWEIANVVGTPSFEP
jgi:hypothetical protein